MNPTPLRTPLQCAQEQLEAYNDRDIERFAAVYASNVQLIDLATGEPFCNGRTELVARYGTMFSEKTELHCSLVNRIVCPPFVFDEEHVSGLAPDTIVHAVATYEIVEGFIVRAWFVRERP